jgi:hypothetical protein
MPHFPGNPRLHFEKKPTTHHKAGIYLGSFLQIHFAALLADGQVKFKFAEGEGTGGRSGGCWSGLRL